MLCQTVVPPHRRSPRLWFNTAEHAGMAPQRGLYFHVCQSSSIPAQGGHKYTFMPPREILKGAVCPSPVWTRLAIFLIDDGGEVWRTPRRVPPSHLFGSFTFEHNSCRLYLCGLRTPLRSCFSASREKSNLSGKSPKNEFLWNYWIFILEGLRVRSLYWDFWFLGPVLDIKTCKLPVFGNDHMILGTLHQAVYTWQWAGTWHWQEKPLVWVFPSVRPHMVAQKRARPRSI